MKRAEKSKKSITEIINAAIKLYTKSGSPDISINELCRENNISKGKFYHYFSSKDDLFIVVSSYIVDDICKEIESFEVDADKSLEENLKHYYSERINYWIDHPEYSMIVYYLFSNIDYEFRKAFHPLRAQFNASLNTKTMEILHTANIKMNLSDSELLEVMKVVYDSLFLNDMHKIVTTQLKGNYAHANKMSEDLLDLYGRLINVLLHGIISENAPEE